MNFCLWNPCSLKGRVLRFERKGLGSSPNRSILERNANFLGLMQLNFSFIMNYIFFCYILLFFFSFGFIYFVGYNMFIVLVYLELAALSISAILVVTASNFDNFYAEFFAVSLITAVGAESAIAISLLIAMNNVGVMLNAEEFSKLKG